MRTRRVLVRTGDLDRVEEVAVGTTAVSVVEGVGFDELPPMISSTL